jgi:hypothetical protein
MGFSEQEVMLRLQLLHCSLKYYFLVKVLSKLFAAAAAAAAAAEIKETAALSVQKILKS